METTRLSSKGQVILPKSVREAHHWTPGTEFEVVDHPEGVLLRPKSCFAVTELDDVVGCAGYQGVAKTLDDMEEAIARGASQQHAGGRY